MSHYSCWKYFRAGIKGHYHSNQTAPGVFMCLLQIFSSHACREAISWRAELPWTVWQEFCPEHHNNRHKWLSMNSQLLCLMFVGIGNEFNTWRGGCFLFFPVLPASVPCISLPSSTNGRVHISEVRRPPRRLTLVFRQESEDILTSLLHNNVRSSSERPCGGISFSVLTLTFQRLSISTSSAYFAFSVFPVTTTRWKDCTGSEK